MSETIALSVLVFIIGVMAGRLSVKKGGQDSGGMQFSLAGNLIQVEGWVVRLVWHTIMNPTEQAAMVLVDQLYANGKKPSDIQLDTAQNAWLSAFTRWLGTEPGQDWAAKNAPHLLGE